MKNIKKIKNNKGLALLFAVFVSSLILSVGASIISVSLKQIKLSGSARDSQYAFYAANTGIECAYYWDFVGLPNEAPVFATSSGSVIPTIDNGFGLVSCAGVSFIDSDSSGSDGCNFKTPGNTWCVDGLTPEDAVSRFRLNFTGAAEYCADVFVAKEKIDDGTIATIIESRGYNTCDDTNPRRLERGLRVFY